MFAEFLGEMQDPKTRELHEMELRRLAEQHNEENISTPELIIPNQGYCIKIKDNGSGSGKIFINVCFHDQIQAAIGIDTVTCFLTDQLIGILQELLLGYRPQASNQLESIFRFPMFLRLLTLNWITVSVC